MKINREFINFLDSYIWANQEREKFCVCQKKKSTSLYKTAEILKKQLFKQIFVKRFVKNKSIHKLQNKNTIINKHTR